MARTFSRWLLPALLCAVSVVAAGCASRKFMPAQYTPEMEGRVRIDGARTVVLCAPFDFISPEERATYDSRFDPSYYVEDMLQQELSASGVTFVPAKFDSGASFEDLARALLSAPVVEEDCVVLASAVIWFPDVSTMACDVKVFSGKGELLFEKRGLCVSLCSWWNPKGLPSVPFDASLADNDPHKRKEYDSYLRSARSVMRQIFNDPDFQKVLK